MAKLKYIKWDLREQGVIHKGMTKRGTRIKITQEEGPKWQIIYK